MHYNTAIAITQLQTYLNSNGHLNEWPEAKVNEHIGILWSDKIINSIQSDITAAYPALNLEVRQINFTRDAIDDRTQNLYYLLVAFSDTKHNEHIDAYIKLYITLNKSAVYLTSKYANVAKWHGNSRMLSSIFKKLKNADSNLGYFNPPNMEELTHLSLLDKIKRIFR